MLRNTNTNEVLQHLRDRLFIKLGKRNHEKSSWFTPIAVLARSMWNSVANCFGALPIEAIWRVFRSSGRCRNRAASMPE